MGPGPTGNSGTGTDGLGVTGVSGDLWETGGGFGRMRQTRGQHAVEGLGGPDPRTRRGCVEGLEVHGLSGVAGVAGAGGPERSGV